jgi:hypothetical protein
MKKMLFGLIATVMISVSGFAKNDLNESIVVKKEVSVKIENCLNHLKISFDLGNISNLSQTELNNLLDNLPAQIINSDQFAECTITYTATITFMGQSMTISASGSAATCAEAVRIARSGLKSEKEAAVKMIKEMFFD